MTSNDEEEIIFSSQEIGSQENNNAIVEATDEFEEGECSKDSQNIAGVDDGQDKAKNTKGQVTLDQSAKRLIEEKINQSFEKVQNFFEQKFADMARVLELQGQLAENQRSLEVLKEKGRSEPLPTEMDGSSDITIYRNAVERKRDSSSSDDNGVDTSDEIFNVPDNMLSDVSIAEHELEKKKGMKVASAGGQLKQSDSGEENCQPQSSDSTKGKRLAEDKADRMARD